LDKRYKITTTPKTYPAGTVPAHLRVTLVSPDFTAPEQALPVGDGEVDFTGLPDGAYVMTAELVDASGGLIGAPVSIAVVIANDVVISSPESITEIV
jgi:hypothetical protein